MWLLHKYLWLPHTKSINHYFTRGCEQGPRMATCSSRVVSWLGLKQGCFFRHSVWVVSISLGDGTVTLDHLPQKNNCFISMGSGICKWLETASVNLSTIYPPSRKEQNPQKLETSIEQGRGTRCGCCPDRGADQLLRGFRQFWNFNCQPPISM